MISTRLHYDRFAPEVIGITIGLLGIMPSLAINGAIWPLGTAEVAMLSSLMLLASLTILVPLMPYYWCIMPGWYAVNGLVNYGLATNWGLVGHPPDTMFEWAVYAMFIMCVIVLRGAILGNRKPYFN
jgi:hypothetical protein